MSGARGRLGSHRAAESRGPGADSGAFVPRPGRSAGRELAGENGAGERLVVRADVLELAGILTVARHLLAQGVAVLAHRLLDLVRDDLLEQSRRRNDRTGAGVSSTTRARPSKSRATCFRPSPPRWRAAPST